MELVNDDYTLPGWALVALDGWDWWLRVHGLDRYESMPCERLVLRSLTKQAKEFVKAGGATQLSVLHKELIALDRYYLDHYEHRDFKLRYWSFVHRYYPGAELQATHKNAWIADRMGFYSGDPLRPDYRQVISLLDEADARLTVLENLGRYVDLTVDIGYLLTVKPERRVA